MSNKQSECVKVVVRCRPMSSQEKLDQRVTIVDVVQKRGEIQVKNPKNDSNEPPKIFTFDGSYEPGAQQEDIYKETAYPIVESVLEGYNGTIFAYGQTGTGKTHTMEGKDDPPQMRGIIPRTFDHVFQTISGTPNVNFLVRASFLELYNEEIRDLLSKNPKKLEIREKPGSGVYVKDLSSFIIKDAQELREKLEQGRDNRATGATKMNQDSSRSHSLFAITVEQIEKIEMEDRIKVGKLNLVDLAGSERQSKTQATGDRFKEAININQSLTTLGNVISALIDPKSTHVPYRDSKLTRLLQDSLGGNTKTVMIANVGPADYNYDETLSTLRYAHRAKSIQNKPKINEDPKDAMIRQYQEEINKLKQQLESAVNTDSGESNVVGQTKVIEKIIHVEDKERIFKMEQQLQNEKEAIRKKAEEERKKIEQQKNMHDDEKIKLLQKLKEKEEAERIAKEQQEQLIKKIKKMEEKVIIGSAEAEAALKQERELRRAQQEIEEKKKQERMLADQLKEKEEQTLEIQRKYNNQKEEVEDKTKRIKQLSQKLKQIEQENKELDEVLNQENEFEQNRRRELNKELKKQKYILSYFIPEEELEKLLSCPQYQEDMDTNNQWVFPYLEFAGNNINRVNEGQENMNPNNQMDQEMQAILKLESDGHRNVYYVYTEEGPIPEEELIPNDQEQLMKSKASKKPGSAKKRPSSKGGKKRLDSASKKSNSSASTTQSEELYPKSKQIIPGKGAI